MSAPLDDGGPSVFGMSLRDWFAGQVIAGWGEGYHALAVGARPDAQAIAATAYELADAMIVERKKKGLPYQERPGDRDKSQE